MTREQRRVLGLMRDGAVLSGQMNRYPSLKVAGKRPVAQRDLQPLWDAELIFFRLPLTSPVILFSLQPAALALLAEAEA